MINSIDYDSWKLIDIGDCNKLKIQIPKVKLGEKITALQQIVSPFGKVRGIYIL